MTLSTTINRVSYSGDGSTTAFAFSNYFLRSQDLVVISKVTATGVETVKTLTTDYTVTGAGVEAGGTVTMLTAPATGTTLTIYRDPSRLQTLDLAENDSMPAETVEQTFDQLMMNVQRLRDMTDRTVKMSEGFTATFDPTLPATVTANAALLFNAGANGFAVGPTSDQIANAQTYATNAGTSATNAASSASAASSSASSAASSASAAATSATNAATSETNAASSASAAAASAASLGTVTSTNTPNSIVKRDGSGNFSAGTITATLSGNATNVSGTVAIANGGTGQATKTAAFDALSPNTSKGDISVHNGTNNIRQALGTNGQVLVADSSQTSGVKWGSVQGGINYASGDDSTAEGSVGNWGTYHSGTTTPTTLTGGAPTGTITRTTTTPLRGTGSFLYTAGAQGDGAKLAFTIDTTDQGKMLTVSFDYATSGTTADGDYQVYIEDVTNAVIIQPAPYKIPGAVSSVQNSLQVSFQAASNSTSYRVGIHQAVASPGGNLKFDNVSISPVSRLYGAPITDWAAYSPVTGGLGTVSITEAQWRRIGDSIQLRGRISLGTTTASTATIGLPSGLSVDSSKEGSTSIYGIATNQSSTAVFSILVAGADTSFGFGSITAPGGLGKVAGTTLGASGNAVAWTTDPIPVTGWSSSVQISNDADTRVVAARATLSTDPAVSTNAVIPYDAVTYDTHGAVTTGASFKFTAPVPGFYEAAVNGGSATSFQWQLYKNGVLQFKFGINSSATSRGSGVASIQLVAGDYIDIRPDGAVTMTGGATTNYIQIKRLSGPSAIAASESVNARYSTAAGQSITNGATPVIDFGTKDYDSHGAVNTGASWKFTAPVAGKYSVCATVTYNSAAWTVTLETLNLYKNGSAFSTLAFFSGQTSFTNYLSMNGCDEIALLAGDYIDVRTSHGESSARSLQAAATNNHISITRVGN